MASVIEEFLVKFGFDVNTEGLDRMRSKLKSVKEMFETIREPFQTFNEAAEAMKRVAEIAIAPFEKLIDISSESALAADQLAEKATALGIAAEDLEFFGFAAEQTGSSAETLTHSLNILNQQLAAAANGSKEASAQFTKIGIDVRDKTTGKLKEAGAVMQEVMHHLQGIPDPAKRSAVAFDIFGKSAAGMKNFLSTTAEGLEGLRQEFEIFGSRTPEKLFALGDAYDNSTKKIRTAQEGFRNWFAMGFQPVLNGFTKWCEEVIRNWGPRIRLFFYDVGQTINSVAQVVGAGLDTFAQAFGYIIKNLDSILPLLAIFEYKAIASALKTAAAWFLPIAPFVLLFLAVEDLFAFLEGKESVIEDIINLWEEWTAKMSISHPIIAGIMQLISDSLEAVTAMIKVFWDAFREQGIIGFIREVGQTLYTALIQPIKSVMGALGLGGGGTVINPSTAAMANNNTNVSNSSTQANVTQNINAAPGMSETDIANKSSSQFKEMFQQELRGAYPAAAYAR